MDGLGDNLLGVFCGVDYDGGMKIVSQLLTALFGIILIIRGSALNRDGSVIGGSILVGAAVIALAVRRD
jgi:hypothetical protein